MQARFPNARTIYPGHGVPGDPHTLITEQRDYRKYPGYPRVASPPNIQELNIAAVAAELVLERPAILPPAHASP